MSDNDILQESINALSDSNSEALDDQNSNDTLEGEPPVWVDPLLPVLGHQTWTQWHETTIQNQSQ